jgi:hypothetical protein
VGISLGLTGAERQALGVAPEVVATELRAFRKTARLLSSHRAHLISRYPAMWVGIYRGRVRAHNRSLSVVLRHIDKKGLPRQDVILRYIDNGERVLIL